MGMRCQTHLWVYPAHSVRCSRAARLARKKGNNHWQVCVCRRPGWGGRRSHPAPPLLVYMGRLQCAVQSNSNSAEFQPLNKSLCQLRLQYRRTPTVAGLAAYIAECPCGLQDPYLQPLRSAPVPTGRGDVPTCGNADSLATVSRRPLARVPTPLLLPAPSSPQSHRAAETARACTEECCFAARRGASPTRLVPYSPSLPSPSPAPNPR